MGDREVGLCSPLLKLRARIGPSCMTILMSLSSMRMSYTEISPVAKPMPITSMADDCVMHVIAVLPAELPDGAVNKDDTGNEWIQVLHISRINTKIIKMKT